MTGCLSRNFAALTGLALLREHARGIHYGKPAHRRAVIGWRLGLVASVLATGALVGQVDAASTADESAVSSPTPYAKSRVYEDWRKSMSSAVATQPGCFRADYPDKEWTAVPCVTVPLHPHVPRSGSGPVPETVGNGTDWTAQLQNGGLISGSEGSFGTSSTTGEADGGVANLYSLQLNTNRFSTSACNGMANCLGWQQYIFENNPANGVAYVYIQDWLLNYPTSACSSIGYASFTGGGGAIPGCFSNSTGVNVPLQAIQNLSSLTVTGTAVTGGLDQITVSTGTSLYSTYQTDTKLNAGGGWTTSEFNVFGDGNGSQAIFNSGTLVSVETMVSNGQSTGAPVIIYTGDTGETNNLTLSTLYCQVADPTGPYIWFQESYGATPSSSCPLTPISLPAPTVTTTSTISGGVESFSFSWPSVPSATYYIMSRNGSDSKLTGNSSGVTIACQQTVVVTLSSCDAAGCGWPETVLSAKNTSKCN